MCCRTEPKTEKPMPRVLAASLTEEWRTTNGREMIARASWMGTGAFA